MKHFYQFWRDHCGEREKCSDGPCIKDVCVYICHIDYLLNQLNLKHHFCMYDYGWKPHEKDIADTELWAECVL